MFFACVKKIKTCKELGKAIILRHVIFLISIFTNLLSYMIQVTIGFHSTEWSEVAASIWVKKHTHIIHLY